MKVLQYNIMDGCHDQERFQLFDRWMKKQHYDVAGFNEVNGWTAQEFQQKAEEWGYPYSFLFEAESSPYFVGMMSKYPIEKLKADEESFYHALIHVKTQGVHFFVAHLTPFGSEYRETETRRLAEYVDTIEEPVMVMGDLNTLSPLDRNHYESIDLLKKLMSREKSKLQHTQHEEIDYAPMNNLLNAGLIDIGFSETFTYSMPTPLKHDLTRANKLRIDYMLGNEALMEFKPVANIIHNEEVDVLSDHYPIECSWDDA